jgi:CheY-like chemotaxis protein
MVNRISGQRPVVPEVFESDWRIVYALSDFQDDETILEIIHGYLEYFGYDDVCVKNSDAAIAAYTDAMQSGHPFDAVIMDLTVPGGKGGKEAMERLLLIDPGIRAIVSSGYSQDAVIAEYTSYGFKGVLIKPYTVEAFSLVLREVLSR